MSGQTVSNSGAENAAVNVTSKQSEAQDNPFVCKGKKSCMD